MKMEIFAFFAISFEPIKIETCLAPKNDCLNLSFVKHIYVVGKKRLEMVVKVPFAILLFYASEFSKPCHLST